LAPSDPKLLLTFGGIETAKTFRQLRQTTPPLRSGAMMVSRGIILLPHFTPRRRAVDAITQRSRHGVTDSIAGCPAAGFAALAVNDSSGRVLQRNEVISPRTLYLPQYRRYIFLIT
jgi:hypothetical protein